MQNSPLALAADGDIVLSCFQSLRTSLINKGVYFNSNNYGELMTRYLFYRIQQELGSRFISKGDSQNIFLKIVSCLMDDFVGAYSVVAIFSGCLWAWRDPLGMRPLWFGQMIDGKGFYFASKTTALNLMGIYYAKGQIKEVSPSEIYWVDLLSGNHQRALLRQKKPSCSLHL